MIRFLTGFRSISKALKIISCGLLVTALPSAITPALADELTWQKVTQLAGKELQGVAMSSDGSKLFTAAKNGFIYGSNNSGTDWTQQNSGVHNWAAIASSSDGAKLVAADNSSGLIYVSANSGTTWEATTAPAMEWNSVVSSSNGVHLAAITFRNLNPPYRAGSIWVSNDSGVTWTQSDAPDQNWQSIAGSSDGRYLVAGSFNGNIYTSSNYGTTWVASLGAGWRYWYSVSSSANGKLLSAADVARSCITYDAMDEECLIYKEGAIYTSTDFGVTWSEQAGARIANVSAQWMGLASSADGNTIVAGTYRGYIYISKDAGLTWEAQASAGTGNWGQHNLAITPDGTTFFAGDGDSGNILLNLNPAPQINSNASAEATAKVAAVAAAKKREAEKQSARTDISSKLKNSGTLTVESFTKAEILGVTAANFAAVQAELIALPEDSRTDINQVLKIARKYEVVGNIGSDRINNLQSNSFVEVGLIPAASKNKVALVYAVRKLPEESRDTFAEIKTAIDAATAVIKLRQDRMASVIARNLARHSK